MTRLTSAIAAEAGVAAPALDFASFRNAHAGASILVCGCGESLNTLERPESVTTIGVNDVGRRFTPTYLVVVNRRSQFAGDRFRFVETSGARALFTQLPDLGVSHPQVVRFRLGTYGGTDLAGGSVLHYTQNSPYVAVCLAVHMGAARIGLLGVDFTGRHFFPNGRAVHPLAGRAAQIDAEYDRLAKACAARGIQLVNVSAISRLRSLPRLPLESFMAGASASPRATSRPADTQRRKVFFVNYRFLACGDVFTTGLQHAAEQLGIESADAYWDDHALPDKVARFQPDLLFVVHGRQFVKRWGGSFSRYPSAVWLVDEPYEVDDTAGFSNAFDHVFVNDAATLSRHAQARYLPVCYDERVHTGGGEPRRYAVGFIGGANARRERVLDALARHGLLSYVVGGPWRSRRLAAMCLGGNVPPARTAELYRATQVVVNAFRDGHHFNRDRIAATSMNPRIYEALACGALVVSERRPEIDALLPDLPTFESESDVVPLVAGLLDRPDEIAARHAACVDRIRGATYSARLSTVMDVIFNTRPTQEVNVESIAGPSTATDGEAASERTAAGEPPSAAEPVPPPGLGGAWAPHGAFTIESLPESLNIAKAWDGTPGSERGFVTNGSYTSVDLSFELSLGPESCFLAKLLQAGRLDQGSNSYHLLFDGHVTYLARHNRIFKTWPAFDENWRRVRFTYAHGVVSVAFDDGPPYRVQDGLLRQGYGFLGLKGGAARLRNAHISSLVGLAPASGRETAHRVIRQSGRTTSPTVSIITTVYDRPECLRQCIRTVKRLSFRDYEHIIAADCPPPETLDAIAHIVTEEGDDQVQLLTLQRRCNDWGIAPAAAALGRATGQFVCFLSDDNGYLPDHLNQLVAELERDPGLGFVYSSCLYAGLTTLRHPTPRPARIDLGQPLFRRELFERYLGNGLPFNMMAWDWYMIDALLKRGVRWKHVDQATFVFRLQQYPQLMVPR